jgi:hypothetical protein
MRGRIFILALLTIAGAYAGFDGDPLAERVSTTNGTVFLAVRPFYSHSEEPARERWRSDYLWPLYTRKGFKQEEYGRLLFFGYSADFSPDTERDRNWLLPFYFQGTDVHGKNYFALFPLGGTIHEFLGRDRIAFVLFPLYGKSSVNEVDTTSVLWPVYSRSKGEKVDRMRVWPFYGRSNLEGEYSKKFILWPLYNSVRYTNDRNPGGGFILVPIYGRIKTAEADNHWYLAPFFRHVISDDQWIVHAPWPFIQLADGRLHKRIFWPLYGKKKLGPRTKQYWLWPIIWNNQTEYAHYIRRRRFLIPLFVYQSDVVTKPMPNHDVGAVKSKYWKIWPLMSWDRDDGQSRFRMLELWPLRNTPGVERNWTPWWTLYRRIHVEGETAHHLLWGVYRQTRAADEFEWSLLKGLAGYKKTEDSRRYRFLFLWFGGEE